MMADLHLWCFALDLKAEERAELAATLSPDEAERARRFYFDRDRHRFTAARGRLRQILASYLQVAPAEIAFTYGEHGKPALAGGGHLCFNLSHSEGLALCGVTRGRAIGVDLEAIKPERIDDGLLAYVFSASDCALLRSLTPAERCQAFYHGWTRKEAYLKALGSGLSIAPASFDVAVLPGQPAALLRTPWDGDEVHCWQMTDLALAPDFAGAAVVAGRGVSIQLYRLGSPSAVGVGCP